MELRKANVQITVPVSWQFSRGVALDIKVAGMVELYNALPEPARLQIIEAIVAHDGAGQ